MKKKFTLKVRDILTEDLEGWEVILYYAVLPLGFILAALIGALPAIIQSI